jgi:hypothetical protein
VVINKDEKVEYCWQIIDHETCNSKSSYVARMSIKESGPSQGKSASSSSSSSRSSNEINGKHILELNELNEKSLNN